MDIKILQIAADTKNNKEIKNFTHKSKNKNPLCGDEIEITLIVKNKKLNKLYKVFRTNFFKLINF